MQAQVRVLRVGVDAYSTHAALGLENRYDGAGRHIGGWQYNPEVLGSLKYFCGFLFLNT